MGCMLELVPFYAMLSQARVESKSVSILGSPLLVGVTGRALKRGVSQDKCV